MVVRQFEFALLLIIASGLAFYPVMWLARRPRIAILLAFLFVIVLSPLIVPPSHRLMRLLAAVAAVTIGVKLYDHYWNARAGFRPSVWLYAVSLTNPFAIVLRKVLQERRPPWKSDLVTAAVGVAIGASAVLLVIRIFLIDWRWHHLVTEHCAKTIGLFLIIQFLPNGLAAALRLVGIPSTNFGGAFFLARTPAEFWRLYNRPAGQFFHAYVFKPLDGLRHPVVATLLTFAFSGLVHEYVFDIPAGRVLGTQMAFFLVQGLAVIATLRIRPRGWVQVPAILLTFAFNLLTVRLFLASLNAVVPFYVPRIP